MSTFYIKNNQIEENKILIQGEDVNHIKNVLRYQNGDKLEVCDEDGTRFYTKISGMNQNEIILDILEISNDTTEPNVNVVLFQGLPKADKMELIVQKCTELGVSGIVPVIMDRVIVKLDEKNESKKIERWQKIAKEAATQSGRQKIPYVEKAINLKNSIEKLSKYDIVIVPYECEKENYIKNVLRNMDENVKNIAIVVGPEGGFSDGDIEILSELTNMKKVSLGPRILRTETAGFVTLTMAIYELDKL